MKKEKEKEKKNLFYYRRLGKRFNIDSSTVHSLEKKNSFKVGHHAASNTDHMITQLFSNYIKFDTHPR
jgi:hypothetical protein